jgi:hypothetical protein
VICPGDLVTMNFYEDGRWEFMYPALVVSVARGKVNHINEPTVMFVGCPWDDWHAYVVSERWIGWVYCESLQVQERATVTDSPGRRP